MSLMFPPGYADGGSSGGGGGSSSGLPEPTSTTTLSADANSIALDGLGLTSAGDVAEIEIIYDSDCSNLDDISILFNADGSPTSYLNEQFIRGSSSTSPVADTSGRIATNAQANSAGTIRVTALLTAEGKPKIIVRYHQDDNGGYSWQESHVTKNVVESFTKLTLKWDNASADFLTGTVVKVWQ